MPSSTGQYKNWVFTLNNYSSTQRVTLLWRVSEFTYVIYGEEVGEEGTKHLQGYFELNKKKTLKGLKDLLSSYDLKQVHFEPRMGTQAQAIAYCQKDGNWISRGTMSKQGARTDLDQCRRDAQENGMKSVSRWGNLQNIKTAELFLKYNDKPRYAPNDMEVIYIWGPSGTGKTTTAYEMLGTDNTYVWDCATMGTWWEGYDGEKAVIMDDLSPTTVPAKALLAYLGGFPVRAPCKGGSRQCQATKIAITTLKPPKEFWKDHSLKNEDFMQFERRITKVIHLTTTYGRAAEIEASRSSSRGSKKSLPAKVVATLPTPATPVAGSPGNTKGDEPRPGPPPSEDESDSMLSSSEDWINDFK